MSGDIGGPSLTRRGLLALGTTALVSGVAACGGRDNKGRSTESAPGPHQVNVDFEDGSLGLPITHHVGASLSTAYAQSGKFGCRLEPVPANHDLAALALDDTKVFAHNPWATLTISFRLVTLPKSTDSYMNLFELGNTASAYPKSQFTVYFKQDTLVCDFNASETMQITTMPVLGAWHTIDAVVGYGSTSYTADVRFDGGPTKKLVSKDNKTVQGVRSLWIHYPTVPVDYTMDVDSIRVVTSTARPGFLPLSAT